MIHRLKKTMYRQMGQAFTCFVISVCSVNSTIAQTQQNTVGKIRTEGINNEIKIQRKRRGINAELIDAGDYYLHPDGRQIRMLRKKDVYVIESDDSVRSMQRMKNQYGERIKDVANHRLGGHSVIRIDNGDAVKRQRNEQFDVSASMVKSSDNSIRDIKSVFANEQGDGDILLMPKLTVKLESNIDPQVALNRLSSIYGLKLDRKLRVTGNVYSLSLNVKKTERQQFALVRSVMNDAMVEWAEPQFIAKAEKTTFEPNDQFFDEQWYLRNTGQQRSRCDTDCDANNAWDIDIDNLSGSGGNGNSPEVTGTGMVIAIIDDGVQLDHEDLNIWNNPGEGNNNNGVDNDGNGYVDDWRGWDFIMDSDTNPLLENATRTGICGANGFDGTAGQDNDPSPQATSDCTLSGNDGGQVENDDHGTAVAGLAAAEGDNGIGIAGAAYKAEILPIRLISDFDTDDQNNAIADSFCNRAAEAMEYAGAYADVVNNSWTMPVPCSVLETSIANVTAGTVNVNGGALTSKRPNRGSPVLFASGNQASGWVRVSIVVPAGEHAYEWRFLRDGDFDNMLPTGDQAWLDEIRWPDGSTEDFEGSASLSARGFNVGNLAAGAACIAACPNGFISGNAAWIPTASPEPFNGGSQAANIDAASSECSNTYLHLIRDESSPGSISFWVWVDADVSAMQDKFEFLIDGVERLSFGDLASEIINNEIAYPASLSGTIAGVISVGASNSGDLSGVNTASELLETRAFYSQYGPNLDVVAPSSNQQLGIVTTDREGVDGFNDGSESIGNNNYTDTFGGTSASTPIVAGIAVAMLAVDTTFSAEDVRTTLRATADKIGGVAYSSGRNDFYGFGRVNMYSALIEASGIVNNISDAHSCNSNGEIFSFTSAHILFPPIPGNEFFCPAIGDVPQEDELCFPIVAANNNLAVICL